MPESPGIRTRALLVSALVLVIAIVTGGSLLIVRDRVRRQADENLSADLAHSLNTFQNLQSQRRETLIHENALLADLPSLKALMTTHDQRTIADSALEFWRVSESDLFALADKDGQVLTVNTRGAPPSAGLQMSLQQLLADPGKHYLVSGPGLYDVAVRPLYFGSEATGTLLGYVISGYAVDRAFVGLISQGADAQATFLAAGHSVSSTLTKERERQLVDRGSELSTAGSGPIEITLGDEEYLATETDLSAEAAVPLRLAVLKSLAKSKLATHEINRLVILLGLAALLFGTLMMLVLSGMVTRPLEMLADSVRAFGFGDPAHRLPDKGTMEVRELSAAFARMRKEILAKNRALLEAEKLATIGRMASSVSHDLRHYLAAVYANAEFLSSPRLTEAERLELFADIQVAVHGTTELIDSLLVFSKNGTRPQRARRPVLTILEGAAALLRSHPQAGNISIHIDCERPDDTDAFIDAKTLERAFYNLLLNACQSLQVSVGQSSTGQNETGHSEAERIVQVRLVSTPQTIDVTILDSGAGVPLGIRDSLFQPFVSEGKQSGTGLGLTLAHAVAEEHGGTVNLVSTRPGETIFQIWILRNPAEQPTSPFEASATPTLAGAAEKTA